MPESSSQPLPSLPKLLKATGVAFVAAAAILITTVLPAEYGYDPTGVGKMIGLIDMSDDDPVEATANVSDAANLFPAEGAIGADAGIIPKQDVVLRRQAPFRSDEMSLVLQPAEGVEVKARMLQGEKFIFSWETDGGDVFVDMHGERPDADDEFTSYWEEKRFTQASGVFTAPFDGTHGWYWRNRESRPVSISIKISGFYEGLFKP